jgi:hypothetical protein
MSKKANISSMGEMVLARRLDPVVVLINMYKNRYRIFQILYFPWLEGVVMDSWMIHWVCGSI